MSKRKKLMKYCNLHDYNETSHCFSDSTHQTCCMLGPKARKHADATGNPIGKASKKAANLRRKKNKNKKSKKTLTPWCTCIGSNVCADYSKFKDGTHIKFINIPTSKNSIITNIDSDCEDDVRKKLFLGSHLTPGVKNNRKKCSRKSRKKIKIRKFK